MLEDPVLLLPAVCQGFAHVCFTIMLWSSLGFDHLGTKAGSSRLSLGVPPSYQTPMLSVHRCSQGTQNVNSGRHKTDIFLRCYCPDFLHSQLQGHLSMFTIPSILPLLTHCSQWAVFHLHYSNCCGKFCDKNDNEGLPLLRKNIQEIKKSIYPFRDIMSLVCNTIYFYFQILKSPWLKKQLYPFPISPYFLLSFLVTLCQVANIFHG